MKFVNWIVIWFIWICIQGAKSNLKLKFEKIRDDEKKYVEITFPKAEKLHFAPEPLLLAKYPKFVKQIPPRQQVWTLVSAPPKYDTYASFLAVAHNTTLLLCDTFLFEAKHMFRNSADPQKDPSYTCRSHEERFIDHPPFPTEIEITRLLGFLNASSLPIELDWPKSFVEKFIPTVENYTSIFLCKSDQECNILLKDNYSGLYKQYKFKNLNIWTVSLDLLTTVEDNRPLVWQLLCTVQDEAFKQDCKARAHVQHTSLISLPFSNRIKYPSVQVKRRKRFIIAFAGTAAFTALAVYLSQIGSQMRDLGKKHNELVTLLEEQFDIIFQNMSRLSQQVEQNTILTTFLLHSAEIQDLRNLVDHLDTSFGTVLTTLVAVCNIFEEKLHKPDRSFTHTLLSAIDRNWTSIPLAPNLEKFSVNSKRRLNDYLITIRAPTKESWKFTALYKVKLRWHECSLLSNETIGNNKTGHFQFFPSNTTLFEISQHFIRNQYLTDTAFIAHSDTSYMYVSKECVDNPLQCTNDATRASIAPFEFTLTTKNWNCNHQRPQTQ